MLAFGTLAWFQHFILFLAIFLLRKKCERERWKQPGPNTKREKRRHVVNRIWKVKVVSRVERSESEEVKNVSFSTWMTSTDNGEWFRILEFYNPKYEIPLRVMKISSPPLIRRKKSVVCRAWKIIPLYTLMPPPPPQLVVAITFLY